MNSKKNNIALAVLFLFGVLVFVLLSRLAAQTPTRSAQQASKTPPQSESQITPEQTNKAEDFFSAGENVEVKSESVVGDAVLAGANVKIAGKVQGKEASNMPTMKDVTKIFLARKRIAVAGVSRTPGNAANHIYRTLRANGYQVFAVNPNAATVEGDTSYANLKSIPEKPEGVVIVTQPNVTDELVRECAELGIKNVWMHNGTGTSVSENAVAFCRANGINVIPGGCPMMFVSNADFGHRCMRWWQNLTGKLPREI